MELYNNVSSEVAKLVTERYSTSFSLASRLFEPSVKQHIYAIYALVRIADEIVDSYQGPDARQLLADLEKEIYVSMKRGFSTNIVVQAFSQTASQFSIDKQLVKCFFASMATDADQVTFNQQQYEDYIYGSAEVVGLMCLKVFVGGDKTRYNHLKAGARSLGAAYQKVNFLRDMAADQTQLGRYYFPVGSFDSFDETTKDLITAEIKTDFDRAAVALLDLPQSSRSAVMASYRYYTLLLKKLQATPAQALKTTRVRVPNSQKLAVLLSGYIRSKLRLS